MYAIFAQSSTDPCPELELAKLLASQPVIRSEVTDTISEHQLSVPASPHSDSASGFSPEPDSVSRADGSTHVHFESSIVSDANASAESNSQATLTNLSQSSSDMVSTTTNQPTAQANSLQTVNSTVFQHTADSGSSNQEPQPASAEKDGTPSRTPAPAPASLALWSRSRPLAVLDRAGPGLLALVADADVAGIDIEFGIGMSRSGASTIAPNALADGLAVIIDTRQPPPNSSNAADKDKKARHRSQSSKKPNAPDSTSSSDASAGASRSRASDSALTGTTSVAGDRSVRATLPCEWVTPLGVLFGHIVLTREYLYFTGDPHTTRENLDTPDSPSNTALLALLPGLLDAHAHKCIDTKCHII